MKKILVILALFCFKSGVGQDVAFSSESIIINKIPCFSYERTGNGFAIKSSDNKILNIGNIKNISPGKFSTKYNFLTVNKEFYNEKINGRNSLIFSLVQTIVIDSCELNEKRLLEFSKKYNQL